MQFNFFYSQQDANGHCDSFIKKANFTPQCLAISLHSPFPLTLFFCNFNNASLEQLTQIHCLNFCGGFQNTFFSSKALQEPWYLSQLYYHMGHTFGISLKIIKKLLITLNWYYVIHEFVFDLMFLFMFYIDQQVLLYLNVSPVLCLFKKKKC